MDPSRRSPDARLRAAAARLLLVLGSVALLTVGGLTVGGVTVGGVTVGDGDLARTSAGPALAAAATSSGAAPGRPSGSSTRDRGTATERSAPLRALEVRGAGLAGVPGPAQAPEGFPPGSSAPGAPGAEDSAVLTWRSSAPSGGSEGTVDSRGPPVPAGTDATLPPRP